MKRDWAGHICYVEVLSLRHSLTLTVLSGTHLCWVDRTGRNDVCPEYWLKYYTDINLCCVYTWFRLYASLLLTNLPNLCFSNALENLGNLNCNKEIHPMVLQGNKSALGNVPSIGLTSRHLIYDVVIDKMSRCRTYGRKVTQCQFVSLQFHGVYFFIAVQVAQVAWPLHLRWWDVTLHYHECRLLWLHVCSDSRISVSEKQKPQHWYTPWRP